MKVTVHEVTEVTRKLDVTIPSETVEEELDRVYEEIGKKAQLKGFRPGKIPRGVLEQFYKGDAEGRTQERLVSHHYPLALREAQITPVSHPQVSIQNFKKGEDFSFEAVVEIRPEVQVDGYLGLTLKKGKTTVTAKEVEERLQALRERSAQLIPISENRPPKVGEVVVFDFEGRQGGKPIRGLRAERQMAELGSGSLLPDLEKGILEMSPGEKRRIDVTYPPNGADNKDNKGGALIEYEVTLTEIKEKRLPPLDDDFAKDLGDFQTLDEVKAKIREEIEKEKEERERHQMVREAIQKLAEKNKVPVPEGMVRTELGFMLQDFENSLKGQGLTLDQAGISLETFFEKNREEARLRALSVLLLDAIGKKEGIQVTADELNQRLEQMARHSGQSPEVLRRRFSERGLLPGLEASLGREKILDFILTKAKIKEGKQ